MGISPSMTNASARADAMSAALAENWWAIALRGLFAILFGLVTFFMPGATIATLVLLFAAYMLVDGVFAIVAAIRAAGRHGRWGLLLLEGLADLAAGIVALLWPAITVLVFVFLIAFWSIVSGALMTVAAFKLHIEHGRAFLVVGGLFSIVFGILLVLAPLAGALVMTLWLGAYALVFGAVMLALAFRLRSRRGVPATRAGTGP